MSDSAEAGSEVRRVATVRARIDAALTESGGWLDFAQYMELALYAAGCGYYSAASAAPGRAGDFTTAPELGPADTPSPFASAIAATLADELRARPDLALVELGPGSGRLGADLLVALDRLDALPCRYIQLERSPALARIAAARAATLAPRLASRVEQGANLADVPVDAIVLGNEVLDAQPCLRFEVDADGVSRSLGVVAADAEAAWPSGESGTADLSESRGHSAAGAAGGVGDASRALGYRMGAPLDARLRARLDPFDLAPGYRSEIGVAAERLVAGVAGRLRSGALLLFDYGYPRAEYYHPQRRDGTLRCFRAHRAHADPLDAPGRDDISAHVDFDAVADAGTAAGLELAGYQTQGDFVMASGALAEIEATAASRGVPPPAALTSALRTLLLPGEMGELVKAVLLRRDGDLALGGVDRRARLSACAQRE